MGVDFGERLAIGVSLVKKQKILSKYLDILFFRLYGSIICFQFAMLKILYRVDLPS